MKKSYRYRFTFSDDVWTSDRLDLDLCEDGVDQWFDIPEGVTTAWLCLSREPVRNAYRAEVRKCSCNPRCRFDSVYLDGVEGLDAVETRFAEAIRRHGPYLWVEYDVPA